MSVPLIAFLRFAEASSIAFLSVSETLLPCSFKFFSVECINVSAKDKGTGKEQKIQIQASGGLSDEEINQMVKDAESNKEADKKKRESVDARNQADTL